MSTSVRRYGTGTDDNPELEERLRRMEEEIAKRQLAQLSSNESAQKRARLPTEQVTGIRVDTNIVGGIGVEWNPLNIGDIRRYEVEAATDPGFRNIVESEDTTSPKHVFRTLNPEQTYHIRVRAINSRGDPGNYSAVLNSQTGQATFTNLSRGAATAITTVTQTSGFNPATINSSNRIAMFLHSRLSYETTNDTFIVGISKIGMSLTDQGSLFIRFLVDGDIKIEYENTNTSGIASAGTVTVPGLVVPVLLGQGSHTFEFEIETVDGGNGFPTVIPQSLTYSIWQARN